MTTVPATDRSWLLVSAAINRVGPEFRRLMEILGGLEQQIAELMKPRNVTVHTDRGVIPVDLKYTGLSGGLDNCPTLLMYRVVAEVDWKKLKVIMVNAREWADNVMISIPDHIGLACNVAQTWDGPGLSTPSGMNLR